MQHVITAPLANLGGKYFQQICDILYHLDNKFWWARGIHSKLKSRECNQPHKHVGKSNKVTLTGALQSGSSPQFSQKSYNKFKCRKSTPVQSYDPTLIQSETTKAKLHISSSEHRIAFRLGGKEPVIGTYRRRTGPLVDMESAATCEIHQKGKNTGRK
ncbi:hypothetical protein V6N13_079899 [Hibiscus sabdariffa]